MPTPRARTAAAATAHGAHRRITGRRSLSARRWASIARHMASRGVSGGVW